MTDNLALVNGMRVFDIIQSLTLDDVERFLKSLGVERIERHKNYLVLPTICHNPIDEAESMKLYYYDNYKCFHCYTQCGDSISIIELYQRFREINGSSIDYRQAVEYIKQFITTGSISVNFNKKENPYVLDKDKFLYYNNIVDLPKYSKNVLDCFIKYYPPQWIHEGITKEAMEKYNIRFSIEENKAVIPHYDINDNLIGIRGRAFNEEEIEFGGKYRPITFNDTMYRHQLSYNLYGINKNKDAIRKYRKAVLVEAEKSVLLGDSYLGEDNICVAVCGSSINKYQISLLTNLLDVNEIIVAFDRDFDDVKSNEAKKCRKKIIEQCKKYSNEATFYYIFDESNLLRKHDSPLDRGKEIWETLYKERIRVK